MRTKHLFYSLALSAAFAACSQEEIVSQQGVANIDLGNRPVVGKVALDLGGLESRGTIAEDGEFNSIEFVKGEDGFGARIIDAYTPSGDFKTYGDHPYRNYEFTSYASSNYKYVNAGGNAWETDALMVEGNYLFYYPYNEANLARTANTVYLPMEQTVSAEIPNQPIKDLYEGENPAIVGYAFLKAEGQEATVAPELNHIFAYPQFTFVNNFTEVETVNKEEVNVPKSVTITKVIVSYDGGNNFYKKGVINHEGFVNSFRNFELAQMKDADGNEVYPAVGKGNWAKSKSSLLKTAETADFIDWVTEGPNVAGDIVVTFDGGVTLEPEESFSFNLVMPAGVYYDKKLEFQVFLDNDKMFTKNFTVDDNNYTTLKFAPGLRYPAEEYNNLNTNPTTKPSKGKLGTITLSGDLKDAVEPAAIIDDITEFEAYLNSIGDNSANLQEVANITDVKKENQFTLARDKNTKVAYMQINSAVMKLVEKYLSKGSIQFYSSMEVAEAAETRAAEVIALDQMIFDHVDILSGDVSVADVTAESVHVHGGTLTVPATYSGEQLGEITVDGGEVVLNKAGFMTYDGGVGANTLVVTNVVEDDVEVSAGKLTINANQSLRGNNKGKNLQMNAGELVIAARKTVEFGGTKYTLITDGKIVNNGTINLNANYTIGEAVEFENNGSITGTHNLNNEGYIKTSKSLAIAENEGLIEPTDSSIQIDVTSGNGEINNTIAALIDANDDQIVYAEIPGMTNLEGLKDYDSEAALNKIILTGNWTIDLVEKVVELPEDIDYVEFDGGNLVLKNGEQALDLNVATVIINANTTWTGRSFDLSTVNGIQKIVINTDDEGEEYTFNVIKIACSYAVNTEIKEEVATTKKIDSFEGLLAYAKLVEEGNTEEFTLSGNIDMSNNTWTPIVAENGLNLDGDGKIISGLTAPLLDKNSIEKAGKNIIIKDLTIKDSNFTSDNSEGSYIGAFAAQLGGYSGGSYAKLQLVDCKVLNCTFSNAQYMGGLVGHLGGSGEVTIEGCIVEDCTFDSKYTEDNVKFKGHCGALVGYSECASIENNTVKDVVMTVKGNRGGILVGTATAGSTIEGNTVDNCTLNAEKVTKDEQLLGQEASAATATTTTFK